MSGKEKQDNQQGKAVRERTFKVRLSESEYQLLDFNNPYGSIAKLLRQAAVRKLLKFIILKQKMIRRLKQQRLLNLRIARQSEH